MLFELIHIKNNTKILGFILVLYRDKKQIAGMSLIRLGEKMKILKDNWNELLTLSKKRSSNKKQKSFLN